jgi:hypothetical protein
MQQNKLTVYAVWTLEDCDNISLHLNKDEAEKEYESYGEFARWEEKSFEVKTTVLITHIPLEEDDDD